MQLKKLGILFMSIGLTLLVWGLLFDTSVESGYGRVINIGLANERLMLVLMGGFVFVGGVILFAVFKAKQTKEDEINEQIESESKRAQLNAQVVDTSKAISSNIARDFVLLRCAHAIGIAFLVSSIAEPSLRPSGLFVGLFYGFVLFMLFRPVPHRQAISHGWLLAAISMILLGVRVIISGLVFRDHDYVSPMTLEEVLMAGVFLVPAAIFYFVSRQYAKVSST
jgi:hypothetical protein